MHFFVSRRRFIFFVFPFSLRSYPHSLNFPLHTLSYTINATSTCRYPPFVIVGFLVSRDIPKNTKRSDPCVRVLCPSAAAVYMYQQLLLFTLRACVCMGAKSGSADVRKPTHFQSYFGQQRRQSCVEF